MDSTLRVHFSLYEHIKNVLTAFFQSRWHRHRRRSNLRVKLKKYIRVRLASKINNFKCINIPFSGSIKFGIESLRVRFCCIAKLNYWLYTIEHAYPVQSFEVNDCCDIYKGYLKKTRAISPQKAHPT